MGNRLSTRVEALENRLPNYTPGTAISEADLLDHLREAARVADMATAIPHIPEPIRGDPPGLADLAWSQPENVR